MNRTAPKTHYPNDAGDLTLCGLKLRLHLDARITHDPTRITCGKCADRAEMNQLIDQNDGLLRRLADS